MSNEIVMAASGALAELGIEAVEARCLELPQAKCEVIHRFGPGVYIREVNIPAGTFAVGHYQKTEHTNIMLKGRVTVMLDDGSRSELVAPLMFVGKPGRKVGFVHEDMVWLNVYATTETDVEKLESMFIDKSRAWQEDNQQRRAAQEIARQADRDDYEAVVRSTGMSATEVAAQVEDEADQTSMPLGNWKVMVAPSPIHGMGVFATADITPGEIICPARIFGKRTQAGRFTNHARKPNAAMKALSDGNIYLVAMDSISGCLGGQPGEEITVDYRVSMAEARKCLERAVA